MNDDFFIILINPYGLVIHLIIKLSKIIKQRDCSNIFRKILYEC